MMLFPEIRHNLGRKLNLYSTLPFRRAAALDEGKAEANNDS
jgi:hypothetical protein